MQMSEFLLNTSPDAMRSYTNLRCNLSAIVAALQNVTGVNNAAWYHFWARRKCSQRFVNAEMGASDTR